MNRLRSDALRCMSGLGLESGRLSARFSFPEDFVGFQGHFPGAKVLPGVCQMECAAGMIATWSGRPVRIIKVINAKFMAPVLPAEEVLCECGPLMESGEFDIKAQWSRAGARVSEIKLRVSLDEAPQR